MTELRLLRTFDIPGAMRLKEAASWNQTEDDWTNVLAVEPEGCFCIECDGTLAATATAVCYGNDLAWIGMVLTAPEFRGRGLARQLMQRSIEYARRRGVGWIKLDATDMGLPLYESLGFKGEGSVERWLRPGEVRAGGSQPPRESLPSLPAALDRRAFGADRAAVLVNIGVEVFQAGQDGYALGRSGTNAAYFGPCVTSSSSVALQLRDDYLRRHPGEAVYWDLLGSNPEAVRLATEAGFAVRRKLTRMALRGRPEASPLRNDDSRVFAIAGFEFG